MNDIIYIVLRRLRFPIVLVICVYALSVLGFVLIPGVDDSGNIYRLDFFHAFYFVSFMGTTIGFGEVPYPFTTAQRVWTLVCIYGTVTTWLYSIGKVLGLLQDPIFTRLVKRRRFIRSVESLNTPFYLICGYGSSGATVLANLSVKNIQAVVVDRDQERVDMIDISSIESTVPALCGEASDPEVLNDAGIKNKYCVGVIAVTHDDQVNLSIALASKLLAPERIVISRSNHKEITDNLKSFGTDHVIDPYEIFADQLTWALHKPYHFMLQQWLVNPNDDVYEKLAGTLRHLGNLPHDAIETHTTGKSTDQLEHWIICGYGRFGKAVYKQFMSLPVKCTIIEPNLVSTNAPKGSIKGTGVDERSLGLAGISRATGIIAGSNMDGNNLSIIMTARQLNPKLVTVARQNNLFNHSLFNAANVDVMMEPASLISHRILMLIKNPMQAKFIDLMHENTDLWGQMLLSNLHDLCGSGRIECWTLSVNSLESPGLLEAMNRHDDITFDFLMQSVKKTWSRDVCMPLLLKRGSEYILLPAAETVLEKGDEILFGGVQRVDRYVRRLVLSYGELHYLLTGKDYPRGFVGRWFESKASSVLK